MDAQNALFALFWQKNSPCDISRKTDVCEDLENNDLQSIRPVKARFQAFSVSQFHGKSSSRRLIL